MRRALAFGLLATGLVVAGCGGSRDAATVESNWRLQPPSSTVFSTARGERPHEWHVALLSARTGKPVRNLRRLSADWAVTDPRGGWLVALGRRVLRLLPDGRIMKAWRTLAPEPMIDPVRVGSRLYATVYVYPAIHRYAIAAFDATTGARLWTRRGTGPIVADRTHVFVGNDYARTGAWHPPRLVALDPRTGRPMAWHPPRFGGPGREIVGLARAGSRLYVMGRFHTVGGEKRLGLAALDVRTGHLLSWRQRSGNYAVDEGRLLAWRGQLLLSTPSSFTAFDIRTRQRLQWPARLGGLATSFGPAGRVIYLGGGDPSGFSSAGGHAANNLAAFDQETGRFLEWRPNLDEYVSADPVGRSRGSVLVIGVFTNSLG